MLTDEVLELVTERIVNRMENLNTNILKKIGSNLDEIGQLKPTQAQQLAQTLKYGGDYNKIVKELAKVSKLNKKDIEDIFEEVAKNDYAFAEQFYNYRGVRYIPYEENLALETQVQAIANITAFRCEQMMNPRVLGFGLIDKKTGEKEFKGLKDAYYQLLDEAVLGVSQGKETFDQAMSSRIKEMGSGGLKVIYDSTYINKEGKEVNYSRRLDSAIRMNLKDSLRELHNETQKIFGEQFDADGVEISVHMNPAPDHELVQGRQFSNDEFLKFQTDEDCHSYDGMFFPAVSEETGRDRRAISEYNCYHYVFSILLGYTAPEYTDEQLQEIIDNNNKGFEFDGQHYTNYQGTQLQRQLETAIREQKDIQIMARAGGQEDTVREAQQKITQLTQKYKELSAAAGLPTKMQRMRVSGYKRVATKQPEIKAPALKENKIFISAKENEELANYYIKAWEEDRFLRPQFSEKLKVLKAEKEKGFKDEVIDLSTYEGCEKLMDKVNGLYQGDGIKEVDVRLLSDISRMTYNNIKNNPAWLQDSAMNFTIVKADYLSSRTIAETQMGNVTLNKLYYKKYEELLNEVKDSQEIHQYNNGISRSWHTRTAAGNETMQPYMHETGHIVQKQIAGDVIFHNNQELIKHFEHLPRDEFGGFERKVIEKEMMEEPIRRVMKKEGLTRKEVVDKYVSMYGTTDYNEMFAEMFANSQLGASNALGDELIAYLKELGQWRG